MAPLRQPGAWRAAPAWRLAPVLLAAAALGGCGHIQVRPLATGEVDRSAYALSGPSLEGLRDQARRLCPAGGDVLRAAQRLDGVRAVQPPSESWYGRWWQKAQAELTPSAGESQLVVLCQSVPGQAGLAAMPPVATLLVPAAAPTGARDTDSSASQSAAAAPSMAPIGEGDARASVAAPPGKRSEAASALRPADLRSGMTAAMPAAAVASARPGAAPVLARPAGAASAPILTY